MTTIRKRNAVRILNALENRLEYEVIPQSLTDVYAIFNFSKYWDMPAWSPSRHTRMALLKEMRNL